MLGSALAVGAVCAAPVLAQDNAEAPATLAATAGPEDLPPGCQNHWKTPDVRERSPDRDTYLHTMSNACYANGPINGTVPANSTFRLYFADPYQPSWCYGYSVNLAKKGYVLCETL